jgi:hypothetical protein
MISQTTGFLMIAALLYAIAIHLGAISKPGKFEYLCFAVIGVYYAMGWPL